MDHDIVAAMVEGAGKASTTSSSARTSREASMRVWRTQIRNPDAPPSPQSTSPPATPSASQSGPPPPSSASPSTPRGPFQGTHRIQIKINTKSPKKPLGLAIDDPPQIRFIPGPNSNIARNYDDLPWSPKMQEYINENKKHLAELVTSESEGYKARLVLEGFQPHQWVDFEFEADDSQEPLNEMLHLNFQLRIRCQAVKLMKREAYTGIYASGNEYEMRMFKTYKVIATFP